MKTALTAVCFVQGALAGLKIKAAAGSKIAADDNLIASVRAEARAHMRQMLHQSFISSPKPLDAIGLKRALYTTQQMRGPATGINVVEKRDGAAPHSSNEAVDLRKKFYMDLARLARKSFVERPHEVNVAISSFMENQMKEKSMDQRDSERMAFIEEMFSSAPVVTIGLSPAPEGLIGSSFVEGVRVQVAGGNGADETALRHARSKSFLSNDEIRVQAGSRHWPRASDLVSFLSKGADLKDVEKVAEANLAAAKSYSEAAGSIYGSAGSSGSVSLLSSPAENLLKKFIQRRGLASDEVNGIYSRKTQSPMVWLRMH